MLSDFTSVHTAEDTSEGVVLTSIAAKMDRLISAQKILINGQVKRPRAWAKRRRYFSTTKAANVSQNGEPSVWHQNGPLPGWQLWVYRKSNGLSSTWIQRIFSEHLAQEGRRLPKGVTVWQIYTDYLRNLHAAAVARIRSRRGADLFDRLTAQDRVQYILTIPAAWQKPAIVEQLRKAAVQAGLIRQEQGDTLDFCSEPEASALECYESNV